LPVVDTADPVYTNARIRVDEQGIFEVLEAMEAHEDFLLGARLAVRGSPDATTKLNKRIGRVRKILKEVTRTIEEQGWSPDHDEQERSDS